MKRLSACLFLLSCLCLTSTASALTFSDDFDRADSVVVGNGWDSPAGVPTFEISSNTVTTTGSGHEVLQNPLAQTRNGSVGEEFTLSADVGFTFLATTAWAGVVFNAQNSGDYYTFRFNGIGNVQIVRFQDAAVLGTVLNVQEQFMPIVDRFYRLTVRSQNAYTFDLSITDTVTSSIVYSNTSVSDGQSIYVDGVGGLFRGTHVAKFDNFSITNTTVPEPEVWALLMGGVAMVFVRVSKRI